ncbi:MAG: hypothetical protein R3C03_20065 [Pirellulaceae bacterium]
MSPEHDSNQQHSDASNQDQNADIKDAWIDALLTTIGQRENTLDRVAAAMERISVDVAKNESSNVHHQRRWPRWASLALAASLLVAFFFVAQSFMVPNQAMAAVLRSLKIANLDGPRKYLLQVEYRDTEGELFHVDNDLYVSGNNRFVLRHPGLLPGSSLWLGQDGDESWVVPTIGPIRKGDGSALMRWLKAKPELDTPYLHVTTLLERMSRGYQLEELGNETIRQMDGALVACRHIQGTLLRGRRASLPQTIELWADMESGMAMRMVAVWPLAEGDSGRQRIVLDLNPETETIPDSWWQAEGHYSGTRRIVNLGDISE